MNIVFNLGALHKGGAERVVSNLSNFFSRNENNVSIITTIESNSDYYIDSNVKIFYLDKDNYKKNFLIKNIKRIKNMKKILKKLKPDIVVSFLPEPSYRILFLKLFNRKMKVIVSVRNDPKIEYKSIFNRMVMKLLYPIADGFVFQTEDAKKYFNNKIQKRSRVIPNPIKEEFINRERYTEEKENIIVSVGRLEKQKNQSLLIDAFYDISDKFLNYKLIIYGEGSLRKELENKIKKLNMQNKIFLPGNVDNIQEKIEKAKLFVMTSDYEGMPNALMEAMALGLPCISTNCPCGGPKYLIKDKEDGILVKVNDKEELVNSINYLLKNPEVAKKFGINAINKISKELNPDKINKEWEKYISLIGENK